MANRYWVGDTGSWDDTAHWSTTSGGAGGASQPNANTDDVFFDANSITSDGQTVTVPSGDANAKGIDFSALAHTVTISIPITSRSLFVNGNFTGSSKLTVQGPGLIYFYGIVNQNLSQSGAVLNCPIQLAGANGSGHPTGTVTLTDNLINYSSGYIFFDGNFNANGYNVTAGQCVFQNAAAGKEITVTMGTGTWTVRPTDQSNQFSSYYIWDIAGTGSVLSSTSSAILVFDLSTLAAGITNNVVNFFSGGTTFLSISVTGTGSSQKSLQFISPFTVTNFTISGAPVQVVFSYYVATNYVVTGTFTANGSSGKLILLRSSSVTHEARISAAVANVSYVDVQDNHALGAAISFNDSTGGVDSGNNTNWLFSASPNAVNENVFLSFSGTDGIVQLMNGGYSDNGSPINYELETQELEFGNRGHLKKISDKIGVFNSGGISSQLLASQNGGYKPIPIDLSGRVCTGTDVNLEGHFFTFKWYGSTSINQPIFEGLVIDDVTDLGITKS